MRPWVKGVFNLWCPQENRDFWPPTPRPYEPDSRPLWTSTCRRDEIHVNLLKQLVQWPSGPNAWTEYFIVKLNYSEIESVILLLQIDITNLCWGKIFTVYSVQKQKSGIQNSNFFEWEKTGWCRWAVIFCVDVQMDLTPPLSTWAWFRISVDVINWWPWNMSWTHAMT